MKQLPDSIRKTFILTGVSFTEEELEVLSGIADV